MSAQASAWRAVKTKLNSGWLRDRGAKSSSVLRIGLCVGDIFSLFFCRLCERACQKFISLAVAHLIKSTAFFFLNSHSPCAQGENTHPQNGMWPRKTPAGSSSFSNNACRNALRHRRMTLAVFFLQHRKTKLPKPQNMEVRVILIPVLR